MTHSCLLAQSPGFTGLGALSLPGVSFVCACARALAASAPLLPLRVCVACARRVVPVLGAGRAVPRGRCPSVCPASVPCAVWLTLGGLARSRSPLARLGVVCPLMGGPARPRRSGAEGAGGGGAACVLSSPEAWPGGSEGRGVALPWSVPLPSLGGQQSVCHWRRSGHGGRGLHTAPIRVRVLIPGVVCVAPLCACAGPLACRGRSGSTRVGAWGHMAYCLSGIPPRGPRPFWGEGGLPPGRGGVEGRRPRGPSLASRGP